MIFQCVMSDMLVVYRSIVSYPSIQVLYITSWHKFKSSETQIKTDVSPDWISTLHMVESILEQIMALAAYAAENNIAQLTPTQLEIAKRE